MQLPSFHPERQSGRPHRSHTGQLPFAPCQGDDGPGGAPGHRPGLSPALLSRPEPDQIYLEEHDEGHLRQVREEPERDEDGHSQVVPEVLDKIVICQILDVKVPGRG